MNINIKSKYQDWNSTSVHTSKCFCLICRNSSKMAKITFVTHKHYDNVTISMITKFLQPPFHIFVCQVLCNIIDQKGTYSSPVIPVRLYNEMKKILTHPNGKFSWSSAALNTHSGWCSCSNGLILKSQSKGHLTKGNIINALSPALPLTRDYLDLGVDLLALIIYTKLSMYNICFPNRPVIKHILSHAQKDFLSSLP